MRKKVLQVIEVDILRKRLKGLGLCIGYYGTCTEDPISLKSRIEGREE